MSYTFLLEQGEESSAASFSDIPASVLLRLNLTAEKSCCNGNATAYCPSSQSGMTLEPSTEKTGGEKLMSCVVGSHAKTSALPVAAQGLTDQEVGCGEKCGEWFAKRSPDLFSWKTRQPSLFVDWEEFWLNWPKWGMMRNGECFVVAPQESCITENESLFWPTPQRIDEDFCRMKIESASRAGHQIHVTTELIRMHQKRYPLPSFGEALMGWPIGYSQAGKPLATDKFRQWLAEHGKLCGIENFTTETGSG